MLVGTYVGKDNCDRDTTSVRENINVHDGRSILTYIYTYIYILMWTIVPLESIKYDIST